MPDQTDNVLDNVVEINSDDPCEGDDDMATVPANIDEQNIGRIAAAGAMAHENFVQFGHILDLAYEHDRKMVSLVEALGVREVTSRSGQEGIPAAGKTS